MTPYKNRKLDRKKPVEVYRNLHTGGYSIRQNRLVVAHSDTVHLLDAAFVVQEAGRERCLREGVKNVHAWVSGTLVKPPKTNTKNYDHVSYNPAYGHFHNQSNDMGPIIGADLVYLGPSGCWAWRPIDW